MKNYVVSTSNENHFFTELYEAETEFEQAIQECKVTEKVVLYEIPALPDDCIMNSERDAFFIKCLEEGDEEVLRQVN